MCNATEICEESKLAKHSQGAFYYFEDRMKFKLANWLWLRGCKTMRIARYFTPNLEHALETLVMLIILALLVMLSPIVLIAMLIGHGMTLAGWCLGVKQRRLELREQYKEKERAKENAEHWLKGELIKLEWFRDS